MYKEYILDDDDDDDEEQKPRTKGPNQDFLGALNELCNNEAKYMER